ncbi:GDSL-type esterase/lipase family protein [Corynebacterium massiliense]|uniref:SGNH hydrolase-type esterase domain-containing protein n=1 Tax=Corynebacterium massiliense DSM 45435 TaxID=1121364 RepID=A0ABY7U981_9CORY|nr:GDSL-type esterase/lipase family protein [Corynebacterium massiliense]WCZ33250.1 hypothetical protein CMASS_09190 [Corynebacterium massiliense DSM 45435]
MFKRARRIAVATAMAAGLVSAPHALAEEGQGNLVAIGDSITADPWVGDWAPYWVGQETEATKASPVGCPTSPNNYAKQAGQRLGLPVDDYSCTGLTVSSERNKLFKDHAAKAIEDGALNASTERVIITVGFNDSYSEKFGDGGQRIQHYIDEAAPVVEQNKAAAPNARIQMVGYPTISKDGNVCPLHVVDDKLVPAPPIHLPMVTDFENIAQDMQRGLAERTGTEFIDMKPSTEFNGMCGPDESREFAGVIDTTGPAFNLPFHANSRGHAHIADVIANS